MNLETCSAKEAATLLEGKLGGDICDLSDYVLACTLVNALNRIDALEKRNDLFDQILSNVIVFPTKLSPSTQCQPTQFIPVTPE